MGDSAHRSQPTIQTLEKNLHPPFFSKMRTFFENRLARFHVKLQYPHHKQYLYFCGGLTLFQAEIGFARALWFEGGAFWGKRPNFFYPFFSSFENMSRFSVSIWFDSSNCRETENLETIQNLKKGVHKFRPLESWFNQKGRIVQRLKILKKIKLEKYFFA